MENKQDTILQLPRRSIYASSDPSVITFRDLCYSVQVSKNSKISKKNSENLKSSIPCTIEETQKTSRDSNTKTILKGISGSFHPGRMTAIMGASGSGKTTLLNAISGRLSGGFINGGISVNGSSVSSSEMRKISGFVHQEDVLMSTMTPREIIRMSAQLRLPESMSKDDKESRVKDILILMNMIEAADTVIGSALVHGISGGEKKRTCIATEMITNPSILFLDEPTSGLDTYTAYRVINSLSGLAKQNRSIICTIHQPPSEIFYLFDDLILISDGELVYHGSVSQSVSYFSSLGFSCPMYTNPADYFFMKVLRDSDDVTQYSGQAAALNSLVESHHSISTAEERLSKLRLKWKESKENKALRESIDQQCSNPTGIIVLSTKTKTSINTQLNVLCNRAWTNMIRNETFLRIRLFQSIIFGLMMGAVFFDINGRGIDAQVQDRLGVLYFMITNTFMTSMMATLHVFSEEKVIFKREYTARYYSLFPYYFSKVLVELPFYIFYPFFTITICYFMTGLQRTFSNFLICCAINILNANVAMGFGLVAAAAFPNIGIAMGIMPMIFIPLMIFAGLLVNLKYVTPVLSWMQWISPMKYGFSALCINEFRDLIMIGGKNGNQILNSFGFNEPFSLSINILMQLLFYTTSLIFAYIALCRIAKKMNPKSKSMVTK